MSALTPDSGSDPALSPRPRESRPCVGVMIEGMMAGVSNAAHGSLLCYKITAALSAGIVVKLISPSNQRRAVKV